MKLPKPPRNARAGDLLEVFFVSAVSSLLLVRTYLYITGFPTLGGQGLHIAHMLWGGLLMLAASIITITALGYRAQRTASIVGGLGFGLFIDELGKFITQDNDYFFEPTVALLYIIFILMFIMFRRLRQPRNLTQTEYLLNALTMAEEAVLEDLDPIERERVIRYLQRADQSHPLVPHLIAAFKSIKPTATEVPGWLSRFRRGVEKRYRHFTASSVGANAISGVMVAAGIWSVVSVALSLINIQQTIGEPVLVTWLQLFSAAIALLLALAGMAIIRNSPLTAYGLFIKSSLIHIFLTQFFDFYREQFSALPIFLLNVLIYISLRLLVSQEHRVQLSKHSKPRPQSA